MRKQPKVVQRVMDYLKNIDFYEKLVEELDKDLRNQLKKKKDLHSQV